MSTKWTKKIPEYVYFWGESESGVFGPYVNPQKYRDNIKYSLVKTEYEEDSITTLYHISCVIHDYNSKDKTYPIFDGKPYHEPLIKCLEYLEENKIKDVHVHIGLFYWNQCNWEGLTPDIMQRFVNLNVNIMVSSYKIHPAEKSKK